MGPGMAKDEPFTNAGVQAVFDAYPEPARSRLLALRALILATAAATEGVGPLEETLRWGQPSYLTPKTKAGSTVRIDAMNGGGSAMYFHCQTNLVDTFRAHYGDVLRFAGNRAIEFVDGEPLPEDALRHCVALALTYHRRKRAGSASAA
jgi:hypothetical protein